ncbi:odorant receptor 67c-like isoform X2 [Neodiprion virginianus]|uniref:odorant receptor 67c-like isoform X2 n=1 Tax=Neodiprion virginianus TaxID=2961670 RepID=UPI001EE70E82|nr:odorant receptor 67c-like isoform X2 [Neodiprion virginianus]
MSNSSRAKRILDCDKFSDQFVTAIRALRCLMICMGIWPDKKHDKLYYLLRCFHSVGLVFLLSGEVCWLTNVKDDIDEFFATLGVACALFYVLGKWLTFSWQKVLIRKLTKFMDEDWINLENNALIPKSVPDSKRIMMKHYRTLNIYVCTIVLVYIFTAGEFVIDFLVATNHRDNDTNLGNLLPLTHSWYPLDYDRGYTVQLLAAAQMISMVSALVGSTVVDGFFVITVLHTAGQLEILGDFIERTKYDPMDYECDKTKVKEMAKRHQVLLSVADDIQECFSATILLCVTVSLISTCFHAHAFLRELERGGDNQLIALKYGFSCLVGLMNIFIYSFVGDSLTSQGLVIGTVTYNSEWYNATSFVKGPLSIITAKAWQPIIISAAEIFPLTMQNFTVVYNACYVWTPMCSLLFPRYQMISYNLIRTHTYMLTDG